MYFQVFDNVKVLNSLKSELPTYFAMSENMADDTDLLAWWEQHAKKISSWGKDCQKILLCQPSSACVERVFSMLKHFNDQQESVLEDYVETALIIQ